MLTNCLLKLNHLQRKVNVRAINSSSHLFYHHQQRFFQAEPSKVNEKAEEEEIIDIAPISQDDDLNYPEIEQASGWNASDRWTKMLKEEEVNHTIHGAPRVNMPVRKRDAFYKLGYNENHIPA